MYLNLYLLIFLKGSGGWVQNYVVLGAGRNGRIVDGLLIVMVARDDGAPMSLSYAELLRQSDCSIVSKLFDRILVAIPLLLKPRHRCSTNTVWTDLR